MQSERTAQSREFLKDNIRQAVGAGTCAIAAYNQEAMDLLVGVDGQEEFTVYVAPVGKKHP